MLFKICTKCKKKKLSGEFYKARSFKSGSTYECKECMTAYRYENRERIREYMRVRRTTNPEEFKEQRRKGWSKLDPARRMLIQSRGRAKRKNIKFNIELKDIVVPEVCPILGIPFVAGKKNDYEFTASLDRIRNEEGYVVGNVQVISKKANSMKNSASVEDMIKFAKWVFKTFNVSPE